MKSIASRIVTFGFVLVMAASALGVPDVVFAQNSSDATQAVSSDVSANPVLKSSSDEQESRDLWVGETEVTDKVTSGKGWKYDAESNTLTIDEFKNTKKMDDKEIRCWHDGAGIYYAGDRDLTIEAKGYNTVGGPFADESEDYGTEIEDGYGIRNEGKGAIKFVVRDGGSIEIASGKASLKGSFKVNKGLYVDAGSSITNFEAVKGFDPTTEVKAYEDEKSKYLWIAPNALHAVAVADSDGGYVRAVPDITPTGDEVSLHIFSGFLPDGTLLGIDYELDTLSVTDANGVDVPLTDVDEDEKSFTMPDSDVIVRATFKRESRDLWVGETEVTDKVTSGKGWKYDAESNTLTIEDFENTKNDGEDVYCWHEGAGIYYAGDRELTIEAKGYNVINGPTIDDDYEIEDGYGIRNEGKGAIKFVVRDGGSIEAIGGEGKSALKGSFKVDKGLYVDAGSSLEDFEVVKGFDPTTEVKSYEDEKSRYLWIAPKALHRVAVADSENGHVVVVGSYSVEGDTVILGIFPDIASDGASSGEYTYELDTLSVTSADGVEIPLSDVIDYERPYAEEKSFTMPDSDVIVRATFKRKQYAVVVAPTTHGSVSVDKTMAYEGETVTLSIQPDEGYAAGQPTFSALGVDDVPIIDNSFEMPRADVTVYVTFEKLPTSSSTTTSTTTSTPSTTTKSSGTSSGTTASSGSNSGSSKTLASTGDPTSLATFTPIALIGAGIAALGLRRRCM